MGLESNNIPEHSLVTLHTPKNIPGEDGLKKGTAISALIGICRLWPVEKNTINLPPSIFDLSPPSPAKNRKWKME